MEKMLNAFIRVEKSLQILALISVFVFVGYLGWSHAHHDRTPVPTLSPSLEK